jgi:hypothetical protein
MLEILVRFKKAASLTGAYFTGADEIVRISWKIITKKTGTIFF